ncbi:MAG: twitching motility protein PilT, partial [bacterium]
MPLYVLDTDHLSLLQRGNEAIGIHLLRVSPTEIAITVVSLEEQLRGWLAVINKITTSEQCIRAYRQLKEITLAFSELSILDYNQKADKVF